MAQSFKKLLLMGLLLPLVGCGSGGGNLPNAPKFHGRMFNQNPTAPALAPGAPAVANPQAAEGEKLLNGLRQHLTSARGFDATVRTYSQGHYKAGEHVSELRVSTTSARLIWMKPNELRAEVLQTSNALLEGAAMVTTDGEHITARARGLLGLIPFHLTASDAKMANNRNHSFTDNNPGTLLARLTGPTASWRVVGEGQMGATPVKLVQVDGVHRLDQEVTAEVIGLDPNTMAIMSLAMYGGQTRLIEHTFLKFSWNPTVSGDTFVL